MPRDRIPFKGRESREAQAAAAKRAAQAERIARAKDAIKDVFSKNRPGENVTDQVYGGGAPAEEEDKPKAK
jgi:hypothetical protein